MLLVTDVRDNIGGVNVVEHDLIGSEQISDGSDGWVPKLVRTDPENALLVGEPWVSMEYCMFSSIHSSMRIIANAINQDPTDVRH